MTSKQKTTLRQFITALILIVICLMADNVSAQTKKSKKQSVIVLNAGKSADGRKLYNVIFPDGKAMEFMYNEEVQHGLKTGIWKYNDFLVFNKSNGK